MKLTASGFREYDARWLYPDEIDQEGISHLGAALGSYLHERGCGPHIIVGHDYRSYSPEVKAALVSGLMKTGINILDIGLSLSPTAYFAQRALDVAAVAMVTASHNENGWTGVKMGCEAPLTFGPEEMMRLKAITFGPELKLRDGSTYKKIEHIQEQYIDDLANRAAFARKLRIVLACGNGTAGMFAPQLFERLGAEIIPLHCTLDWDFPHYTPNPENMKMMTELSETVRLHQADLGLAFDGDGDRCGFVDELGQIIFADKIGVLIARHLASTHSHARFIADVKSTAIFTTDPELRRHQAKTRFWITGHSYMKRELYQSGALAGFEKSGHFFFAPPIGYGYDDGLLSGVLLCALLAQQDRPLSALYQSLPQSWMSPTMAPFCPDDKKYQAVKTITEHYQKCDHVAGRAIKECSTVNGVRVVLEDGSFLLARASSNKPSLVIVIESTQSEQDMKLLFKDMDQVLGRIKEIGDYDQKL